MKRSTRGPGVFSDSAESPLQQVWMSHDMRIATDETSLFSEMDPNLTEHESKSLTAYLNEHLENYQHIFDYWNGFSL